MSYDPIVEADSLEALVKEDEWTTTIILPILTK